MKTWKTAYRWARTDNRSVSNPASRLALNVLDARRRVALPAAIHSGHAAAWLRIAAQFRQLGNVAAGRDAVGRARVLRLAVLALAFLLPAGAQADTGSVVAGLSALVSPILAAAVLSATVLAGLGLTWAGLALWGRLTDRPYRPQTRRFELPPCALTFKAVTPRRVKVAATLFALALALPALGAAEGPKARQITKPVSTITVKVMPAEKLEGKAWKITVADVDSCTAWVSSEAPGRDDFGGGGVSGLPEGD